MLNFRSHYINQFFFCENYLGEVDTVIREFKLTARQAVQQFGEDCPQGIARFAKTPKLQQKSLHLFTLLCLGKTLYLTL
jgi:hypothetical protein